MPVVQVHDLLRTIADNLNREIKKMVYIPHGNKESMEVGSRVKHFLMMLAKCMLMDSKFIRHLGVGLWR